MRASYIPLIAAVLVIPSVGYSQQDGPVGGKVGADLGTSATLSAPATRGPYGRPAPVGRPAGFAGAVTPGPVVPENVPVYPQPGGRARASSTATASSSIQTRIASCEFSTSDREFGYEGHRWEALIKSANFRLRSEPSI